MMYMRNMGSPRVAPFQPQGVASSAGGGSDLQRYQTLQAMLHAKEQEHAINLRQIEQLQQYRDQLLQQQRTLGPGRIDAPGYTTPALPAGSTVSHSRFQPFFTASHTNTSARSNEAQFPTLEQAPDQHSVVDLKKYQLLRRLMAAEEEQAMQLRQLEQLQQYQDQLRSVPGATRSSVLNTNPYPSMASVSSNSGLKEPPMSLRLTPKISDDSTIATNTSTDAKLSPLPVATDPATVLEQEKQKPKRKDTKWLTSLQELEKYKQEHGDCIVPRGYTLNPRLASWVAEQRYVCCSALLCVGLLRHACCIYLTRALTFLSLWPYRKQYKLLKDGKQSSITTERIALLLEIDFAWNAQEAAWARHMSELKRFRRETGHCHVPLNEPRYPRLGLWVKEQRRHYMLLKQDKQSHMNPERAKELDEIGFCWDTHEATWLERLRELTEFKEKKGNCAVPTNYTENPKLGTWSNHQRRQFKRFKDGKPCHITEERIKALELLGFVWFLRVKRESDTSSDEFSDSASHDVRSNKRPRLDF